MAISQLSSRNIKSWVMESGHLPFEDISNYENIFIRGLKEVGSYLKKEKV
jgi:hypothetical protein